MTSARPEFQDGGFRPLQIYEQVAEKIRDEIRAGRYAPDFRLPSERELAALLTVGRPAVREAIGALQNEGLVYTKRNSGTYVVSAPLEVLAQTGGARSAAEADVSPTSTLDVRLILEPADRAPRGREGPARPCRGTLSRADGNHYRYRRSLPARAVERERPAVPSAARADDGR